MRPVHILGGGLAGLSLAGALARRSVPVTVYEKSHYPRHKVCGEFITGLKEGVRRELELDQLFEGSMLHTSSAWYYRDQHIFTRRLPQPAIGISRWALDERLALAARAAGAEIVEDIGYKPMPLSDGSAGWVDAAGVSRGPKADPQSQRWNGLKVHLRGIVLKADLELHLGYRAYAGLSRVEGDTVNLCMLLHASACSSSHLRTIEEALQAVGLGRLVDSIQRAEVVEASRSATAGVVINTPRQTGDSLALGDSAGMIAPFTGHGMAMAFESASMALDPLTHYSRGTLGWAEACSLVREQFQAIRSPKLRWANRLHPLLIHPCFQRPGAFISQLPIFPWKLLFRLTHS